MEIQQDLILHTRILRPSFLCYEQLIENVMFSITHRTVAKLAMLGLSREYFSQHRTHLIAIHKFAKTYQPTQAAHWYTKDSFIHRITNRVLGIENIEHCNLLRSYISHLSEQLYQLKYQQQKQIKETGTHTTLYRGLRQSERHLETLGSLVGHGILVKGFMSTSRNKQIALCYAGVSHSQSLQSQALLIEIYVDMTAPDIIAADIAHLSNFPEEREVLFDMGSQFCVESLKYDSSDLLWHCRLVAMSNKSTIIELSPCISSDESCIDLSTYAEEEAKLERIMCRERQEKFRSIHKNQESESLWQKSSSMSWIATSSADRARILQQKALTHWHRDSDLHQFRSECKHALQVFKQGMDDIFTENSDIACLFNNLGYTSHHLGEMEFAVSLLKQAFKIRDRLGSSEHFRAQSLRNLGLVYTNLDDYENAFASLSQALIIGQRARPTAQWSTSQTLRNFGYFYHMQGDYVQAIRYFSEALETFRQCEDLCIESYNT